MAGQFAHLSASARIQLELSNDDRIVAIHSARWIQHPRAKRALARLNFLFRYPKCARMQCLLIYGDSGMGKTMILEKFMREHPSTFDKEAGMARIPIVAVQMPPAPDERRFYTQLMAAVGAPSGPDDRIHRLEDRTIRLLRRMSISVRNFSNGH